MRQLLSEYGLKLSVYISHLISRSMLLRAKRYPNALSSIIIFHRKKRHKEHEREHHKLISMITFCHLHHSQFERNRIL